MTNANEFEAIHAKLDAIIELLSKNKPQKIKSRWRWRDPNFPNELQELLLKHNMSPSDLAVKIWGRYKNKEGKYVARGRDRISVWLRGLNYPSKVNHQKILDVFNLV